MKDNITRILQITDMHLFALKTTSLLKVNTYNSLAAVLDIVKKTLTHEAFDLIVLSGDISQDGSSESYQHIIEMMASIPNKIAWIPGNHDITDTINAAFKTSSFSEEKHFTLNDWQIILLDTHKDNEISGFIHPLQLEYLNTTLQNHLEHALIFLHHQILPVGARWLDAYKVANGHKFLDIIDKFPHVKAVVFGHVHQDTRHDRKGIPYYSTPSTSIQFKPRTPNFALDPLMPGFRVIELHPDGRIHTHVKRIPMCAEFLPDTKSTGY